MPLHIPLPPGAIDSHAHVFDPAAFPYAEDRSYTPGPATLADYRSFAAGLGLERVVLVQPSPYGTDNSALCRSLSELGPQKARGIAVIDDTTTADGLDDLQGFGVVGVRLNLEAKGERRAQVLAPALEQLLEQIDGRQLAVELFAACDLLEEVQVLLQQADGPVILDHFAGAKASLGTAQQGLDAVLDLLSRGNVWIKLSGPYRACPGDPGFHDLDPIARQIITANPARVVWASDWPHTGGGKDRLNRPITQIEPFRQHDTADELNRLGHWAGDEETLHRILVDNPARLFHFPTPTTDGSHHVKDDTHPLFR